MIRSMSLLSASKPSRKSFSNLMHLPISSLEVDTEFWSLSRNIWIARTQLRWTAACAAALTLAAHLAEMIKPIVQVFQEALRFAL